MTETTWVSFGTLSMCLPLKTLLHFPLNVDFLSWLILFPQLRSRLWSFEFSSSDQYEILQTSSIVNNLSAHCFEQFLGRTKLRESEAEQNPAILTWKNPPGSHRNAFRSLIIELDPIEGRNLGRRHSVSENWTNLRVLVLRHKLRLHENARRSCKQFVSLVRIGRTFQHVAHSFSVFDCVLISFSNTDAIIASSIS